MASSNMPVAALASDVISPAAARDAESAARGRKILARIQAVYPTARLLRDSAYAAWGAVEIDGVEISLGAALGSERAIRKVVSREKRGRKADAAMGAGAWIVTASGSASGAAKAALGGRRPYLCQLLAGGERRWAMKQKTGSKGHPYFEIDADPGAVVEWRIGDWTEARGAYATTGWAVVGGDGALHRLDRESAHRLADGQVIAGPATDLTVPVATAAEPMLPGCISIRRRGAE